VVLDLGGKAMRRLIASGLAAACGIAALTGTVAAMRALTMPPPPISEPTDHERCVSYAMTKPDAAYKAVLYNCLALLGSR
jgi:hypothetical protein